MNLEIILVGIIVGIANFASRFGPFFVIQKLQGNQQRRGSIWLKIALGSIGISAISAMLVVATLPPCLLYTSPSPRDKVTHLVWRRLLVIGGGGGGGGGGG
ncbi:hypothetical protein ACMZ44_15870, partial [Acinetobacter baumannii]